MRWEDKEGRKLVITVSDVFTTSLLQMAQTQIWFCLNFCLRQEEQKQHWRDLGRELLAKEELEQTRARTVFQTLIRFVHSFSSMSRYAAKPASTRKWRQVLRLLVCRVLVVISLWKV